MEILKEELRRKEEEIKRLLEYDRSHSPIRPTPPTDLPRTLSPLELYQRGVQSRTPVPQIPSLSPLNHQPRSISPFRGDQRPIGRFVSNGNLVTRKDQSERFNLQDLAKNPLFQQPKYTTKHPKIHEDNPITGTHYPGLSRHQLTTDHSPMAGYGSMLFPASHTLRRML